MNTALLTAFIVVSLIGMLTEVAVVVIMLIDTINDTIANKKRREEEEREAMFNGNHRKTFR